MEREGYVKFFEKGEEIQLFYRVSGRGRPLLLLHGNGQDGRVFKRQIEEFRKQYLVVAVDSRGHGRSWLGRSALSFSLFAEDVIRVMDHLHLKKAAVLGYSDGGNAALELALQFPQRVSALVLVSANLNPAGLKEPFRLLVHSAYLCWSLLKQFAPVFRRRQQLFRLVALQPELSAKMLSEMKTPTLVMAGEQDLISEEHTREIAEAIPGAELVIVPNAGHRVLFSRSKQCDELILKFLDRKWKS